MQMIRKKAIIVCSALGFLIVGCEDTNTLPAEKNEKQALEPISKTAVDGIENFDKPPKPVDGLVALQKALVYPESARRKGIEGNSILSIIVGEDGSLQAVKVLKTSGDESCDQAAMKAAKAVKWNPGLRDGLPVSVQITMPIVFKLK